MHLAISNCVVSHVALLSKKVKESLAQPSFNLKSFSTGYILVGWKSWHFCNTVLFGGKGCTKATPSLFFPIQELQQQQLLMSVEATGLGQTNWVLCAP